VSICAQPFINSTAIEKMNLSQNLWNFLRYLRSRNFEGWPIKNSTLDSHLWEKTTFGFHDIIKNVAINDDFLNEAFQFEDSNSWLFVKVSKSIFLAARVAQVNFSCQKNIFTKFW
jgi:hypothetical protein